MPILEAALEALKTLKKEDITELKNFKTPTDTVRLRRLVIEKRGERGEDNAVCCVLCDVRCVVLHANTGATTLLSFLSFHSSPPSSTLLLPPPPSSSLLHCTG